MAETQLIEYKGQLQTLGAWAKQYNIDTRTLRRRLASGWALERALGEPIQVRPTAQQTTGKDLKAMVLSELAHIWQTEGQAKVSAAVKAGLDTDPLKIYKEIFFPLLPKDSLISDTPAPNQQPTFIQINGIDATKADRYEIIG